MDRYKFRGKAVNEDGEILDNWVYGSLLDRDIIIPFNEVEVDGTSMWVHEFQSVAEHTVGQWTGLKDKNGKEIYEGDIVKFTFDDEDSCMGNTYDEIYIVEWNNRYLQIEFSDNKYHPLGTNQGKYNLHSLSHMSYEIEVISNIHDNPELLER